MNIHENKENRRRSESRCSYCRQKGHNQYSCNRVKQDWVFWKNLQVPNKNGKITRSGWYHSARDWGTWYEHCKKTHMIMVDREETAKSPTPLQGRPKAQRLCGFCKESGHTRSKCEVMKGFLKDCYAANINWRRAAYQEIVVEKGISVGSAVVIRYNASSWSGEKSCDYNGIILSINWDTLNVFTALPSQHDDARSPIKIKLALSNGEVIMISKKLDEYLSCIGSGAHNGLYSNSYEFKKVVAPAKQLLGEDWINGYKGAFETLTRKRTLAQLRNGTHSDYYKCDLIAHIDSWK